MTIPFTIQEKMLGFSHTPPNASPPPPSSLPLPPLPSPTSDNVHDPLLRIDQLKTSFQNLSPQQQEWLLSEIVDQCDHSQLTFLHSMVTPRLKVDFLKRLPIEISLHIVSFIDDPVTLGKMGCVSKHWNQLLKDETIWKGLCDQHQYQRHYRYNNNRNNNNVYTKSPLSSNTNIPSSSSTSTSYSTINDDALPLVSQRQQQPQSTKDGDNGGFSYRQHFIRKYSITTAWKHGGHIKVVEQGLEGLVTSLQCDDKYIVIGCENHRIEVFDTATGNKVRSLLGHKGGVWALEFVGDDDVEDPQEQQRVLVSAGCDRDVRVWNLETGELRHTLRGHISTVRCLKMKDKRKVVTGSRDCTLRIWDVEQGEATHVLYGHQDSVRCLDISGNVVVSGSYDNTARIWDLTTGECLHVLLGHESNIYSIVTDGIKVAAGSLSTHIRVWSVATGECLSVLHGHTSLIGQLELVESTLVSGGADGCLRVWNWNEPSFECLQRISAHDNSITCLQCDDRWILSSGNDGRVKLWDRKEGRLVRTLTVPAKTVWKSQFNESKAVLLMFRTLAPTTDEGNTVLEIHNFDTFDT